VQSVRSVGVGQVPHVTERGIDFKLSVPIKEAPFIGKGRTSEIGGRDAIVGRSVRVRGRS
jgi:hypothetical protein